MPRFLALTLAALLFSISPVAFAEEGDEGAPVTEAPMSVIWAPGGPTLFGDTVNRDGFHFQVAFGWGGGPDSEGLFHAMEIGYTLENGWTLGYLHTFIQNEGFGEMHGGPDLFGGHMFEVKVPISRRPQEV